jgi:hypothetical protein
MWFLCSRRTFSASIYQVLPEIIELWGLNVQTLASQDDMDRF